MSSGAEYLRTPLQYLRGVGPRRAAEFKRVGLLTIEDLLYRFPFRYEDRARFAEIAQLRPGEFATISCEVVTTALRPTRRRNLRIFEMMVRDASGVAKVIFFNQAYLKDTFHPLQRAILHGKVERLGTHGIQITNPHYEIIRETPARDSAAAEGGDIHIGRIVPIYERIASLTTNVQRAIVHGALQKLPDALPDLLPLEIRARRDLPALAPALRALHFPPAGQSLEQLNAFRAAAQVRVIFEEYFLFQIGVLARRRQIRTEQKPRSVVITDAVRDAVRAILPFKPTAGQKQALKEIVDDMKGPHPMYRLLQGEVGSGKTIVALQAAIVAMENRFQVAFMAPTEILADQHYITIRTILEKTRYRVALLTGSTPARRKREILAELASGTTHMVIGTHALVEDPVVFRELGLIVIDEQHRFGVTQRAGLRSKGRLPDVLVMTATPIPRTLALTMYGDVDVSTIRELPPGRKPIATTARPESRRDEVYAFVRAQIEQGRQAYIIYPIIEESEKVDLKAATEMADHLATDIFPEFRVALLHGRLKQDVKERVMRAFARGEYDILVTTTVVEVGVDVPNATVMMIEHADRFGLSQLHQLRGRVGRGAHASHCILLYQHPLTDEAERRLRAIASTTDGFKLAEVDLELRGPGDFFGTRQSGVELLRVGSLLRDFGIMEDARREAQSYLDTPDGPRLAERVLEDWNTRFGLVGVG